MNLELQHLELDLEKVAFAHVAGFVAQLADVDSFLKAVEVLLGEIDGGLREKDGDELLRNVEDQLALVVSNGGGGGSGLILGGLQAVLALRAAFEGVAGAEVKLRLVIDI